MAEEDLTASHWDDVFSPSPFASGIPNILQSEEFAPPRYDDEDGTEEQESEHLQEQEQDQEQGQERGTENPQSGDLGNEFLHGNESTSPLVSDNVSTEATKSIVNENAVSKKKNQTLLSSLTKDIDDTPLAASTTFNTMPKSVVSKNDSLFTGTDSIDNKFSEFSGSSDFTSPDSKPKPSSVSTGPVKMFKAPRVRKAKSAKKFKVKEVEKEPVKEETTTSASLGPLGDSLQSSLQISEDKKSSKEELSAAEKLVESVNAPLYQIDNKVAQGKKQDEEPYDKVDMIKNKKLSEQIGKFFKEKEEAKKNGSIAKKPEPEPDLQKLDIVVGDPTKVGDITSAHIVYTVRTTSESGLIQNNEVVVTRRYKDFRWLYHQLQANNPGCIIPPPPSKQAMGRFNEQFIENRRFALERMLTKIAGNGVLQKDSDFLMFLQSPNFASDSKEREKITGSGASNANDDFEYSSSGAAPGSSGGAGGLMSALGGAFSFSNRVTDEDGFFIEQKSYMEDLDMQLKAFHRNFEMIVHQRNELSVIVEEFSNAVLALAAIETSKSTNDLLVAFANTQIRIKEVMERQSMQDLITLGSVLDEYIRILGSVRAVFSQRYKALVASSNAEYEYSKKQSALEKLIKNHRNQVDKIEVMKREVKVFELKHNTCKEAFEQISKTFKKELNKLEFEKIEDFRNAVETFLESLIEGQKESIELWETFYSRQKLDVVDEFTSLGVN